MLRLVFRVPTLGGSRLFATKRKSKNSQPVVEKSPEIVLSADAKDHSEDLLELAGFLTRSFGRIGIASTVHPDFGKNDLKSQIEKIDADKIKYSVVLRSRTLQDGFLYLRNAETTIQEQIHVSTLKSRLRALLKPPHHSTE